MIEVNDNKIVFDLMKQIPDHMSSDFSMYWRNMDPSFIKNFLIKWKSLPQNRAIMELLKKDFNEIIVKDLFGRDIFSFEINESVIVRISQYEGFWNIIYTENNGKIIIFTG